MKSKSIFLMAVSLGFGLVAAIGITQVMGRNNQSGPTEEEPVLPVLVAVEDVDINSELVPEMFTEQEWPARLVPEGVATSFEDLEGMVTTARIAERGAVYLTHLVEKTKLRTKKIPAGYKVVGIKLGADDHLYGLLEAGDLVDIMAVIRTGGRRTGDSLTKTFLRRIRVWSVGSKTKKDIEHNETARGSTVVGLLVSEKQAEKIVLAEQIAQLKLAMCSNEEGRVVERSVGTTNADLLSETGLGDSISNLISGFAKSAIQPAQSANPAQLNQQPPKKKFTMVVHTGAGPTQYHFDKQLGHVPTRVKGFEGDSKAPAEETEEVDPASQLDFDDDEKPVDSDSLIEELDSEPRD